MSDPLVGAGIGVQPLTPEYAEVARGWAERLHVPLLPAEAGAAYALQVGAHGLQFAELGVHAAGPIRVDFVAGAVAHRRLYGGGAGQMIAKAVGIQPGVRPTAVDATAGLARDAFVLAQLGCTVRLIERQPVIAALLEDGLARARDDAEVEQIVARMPLVVGDAITLLRAWPYDVPQVIYLDPMFPHRDKSAQVKKEMRLFRPLAGADSDAGELLAAALALASHRVVVKRPRKATCVGGVPPAYALEGKSSRYDVYPIRSFKPSR